MVPLCHVLGLGVCQNMYTFIPLSDLECFEKQNMQKVLNLPKNRSKYVQNNKQK